MGLGVGGMLPVMFTLLAETVRPGTVLTIALVTGGIAAASLRVTALAGAVPMVPAAGCPRVSAAVRASGR